MSKLEYNVNGNNMGRKEETVTSTMVSFVKLRWKQKYESDKSNMVIFTDTVSSRTSSTHLQARTILYLMWKKGKQNICKFNKGFVACAKGIDWRKTRLRNQQWRKMSIPWKGFENKLLNTKYVMNINVKGAFHGERLCVRLNYRSSWFMTGGPLFFSISAAEKVRLAREESDWVCDSGRTLRVELRKSKSVEAIIVEITTTRVNRKINFTETTSNVTTAETAETPGSTAETVKQQPRQCNNNLNNNNWNNLNLNSLNNVNSKLNKLNNNKRS